MFDSDTITYDNANKITDWGSTPYTYDGDGNWTGGNGFSMSYDDLNHNKQEVVSGVTTMNYTYDARGLRVVAQPTSGAKTFYIFDGTTLLGETQNTAGPTAAYTWGASGLVSERLLTGTPKSLWYHFGPQGETRLLTNSSGTSVDTYTYSSYGSQLASTGSDTNPFRYGGQCGYYTHSGDGILCGHRWYSANYSFFFTRDPSGYDGGDNLYQYCYGNPINYADDNGSKPKPHPGSNWFNTNWFRGPEYGPFKNNKVMVKGWHFHLDPFPGSNALMKYHLPQQCKPWRYNALSIIKQNWKKGLKALFEDDDPYVFFWDNVPISTPYDLAHPGMGNSGRG